MTILIGIVLGLFTYGILSLREEKAELQEIREQLTNLQSDLSDVLEVLNTKGIGG